MDVLYRCTQCCLMGKPQSEFMKPPRAFGAYSQKEIYPKILASGSWTRCLPCGDESKNQDSTQKDNMDIESISEDDGIPCNGCKIIRPLFFYGTREHQNHKSRKSSIFCSICKGCKYCKKCEKWKSELNFRPHQDFCKTYQEITCTNCRSFNNFF